MTIWPDNPADDDVEMRRALDRAEIAVQHRLGIGYPDEWLLSHGGVSLKVRHIIQVAVEAAVRDAHNPARTP